MTDPLKVELELGETGRGGGRLVIDGMDLSSHVRALKLTTDIAGLTELTVKLGKLRVNGVSPDTDRVREPASVPAWEPAETGAMDTMEEDQTDDWMKLGGASYCRHPACYAREGHPGLHRTLSGAELTEEEAEAAAKELGMPVADIPF